MRDRGWILAQFIVAGVLLVLSLIGVIGLLAFDAAELTFSFQGAIQAFAIFPGTAVSLIVNALIMRSHREAGLSTAEKVLLGIEFAFIAVLMALHFWPEGLGVAILVWPFHIVLAIVVLIVALVRAASLKNATADPYAPPVLQQPPAG